MRTLVFKLALGCAWLGLTAWLPAAETATATNAPEAVIQQDFRRLMELDDQALEEINHWQQSATNRLAQDDLGRAALTLKIKQRLQAVNDEYEKFFQAHPGYAKARIAYGGFLKDSGSPDAALKQWELARKMDPKEPSVWNNLGNYYGEFGPATNAFACYETAMKLDPNQARYPLSLGQNLLLYRAEAASYYRLTADQVIAKIQGLLRQSLALDPTNFQAATDLAQTYYGIRLPLGTNQAANLQAAQKLSDEAISAWLFAMKLTADTNEIQKIHLHLARVQTSAQRWADARTSLNLVTAPTLAGYKAELEARLEREQEKAKAPAKPAVIKPVIKP